MMENVLIWLVLFILLIAVVLNARKGMRLARGQRRILRLHGLSDSDDVRVAVLEASPYRDDAQQPTDWYAGDDVVAQLPDRIDMGSVDGPPAKNKSLARYPALPAVRERLASGAILLLDDADWLEEREVLARWQREIPSLRVNPEFTEKGASVVMTTL